MKFPAILLAISCLLTATFQCASAQTKSENEASPVMQPQTIDQPVGYWNLKTATLGGQQFWTDVRHVGGWHIQCNSETEHYRLLDEKHIRHTYGNRLHCDQCLDLMIVEGKSKPDQGKVVIVLHGLMRTKNAMEPMAEFLAQNGDYTALNFQYASTRNNVGEHADALKSVIDNLGPKVTEINFIGHSLGNIVVRRYLGDNIDPKSGRQGDPRIKRMVMLGPPNQGSRMARILKTSFLFQTIAGVSGSGLSRKWETLKRTLATPNFEFGIIAGGQQSEENLNNFLLKGKDDFTVSVAETKLTGAHDFLVRPLFHSTMMHQPEVLQASLNFFQHGFFESEQSRRPLLSESTSQSASSLEGSNR